MATGSRLGERLKELLGERVLSLVHALGETTVEVAQEEWLGVARILRDDPSFAFDSMIDLCGVDYLGYGESEWATEDVSNEGFSRGVEGAGPGRFSWEGRPAVAAGPRFAVVVHLLSLTLNQRLRLRCRLTDDAVPLIASLVEIWPAANWFEREAFDLFGIVFEGHPDLRRLLTDYGFVGHPFRKDFPLIGNVEVRYDPEKGRVIYQPVTIEPRVGVPKVVREDSRYQQSRAEKSSNSH